MSSSENILPYVFLPSMLLVGGVRVDCDGSSGVGLGVCEMVLEV